MNYLCFMAQPVLSINLNYLRDELTTGFSLQFFYPQAKASGNLIKWRGSNEQPEYDSERTH